jgi:hypothetical protein
MVPIEQCANNGKAYDNKCHNASGNSNESGVHHVDGEDKEKF